MYFCHPHHILVMCLQLRSPRLGQHNHEKNCLYQILNNALHDAPYAGSKKEGTHHFVLEDSPRGPGI